MPEISIITPVYNAEKYLKHCLESINKQTFQDWDLILVDDGSTDQSGIICDEYASNNPKISIFHKNNEGVSSARNLGLKKATGNWVVFVDADDELPPNALEILYNKAQNGICLVMSGYEIYNEKRDKTYSLDIHNNYIFSVTEVLSLLYKPKIYKYEGYICSKLYNNKIIKNYHLHFNEKIFYNEDRLFCVEYLCNCKDKDKIAYTTEPTYKYFIRNTSAMSNRHKSYNPKWHTDYYAFAEMYDAIRKNFREQNICKEAKNGVFSSYLQQISYLKSFNIKDKQIKKEIDNKFKHVFPLSKINLAIFVFMYKCKIKLTSLLCNT